MSVALIPDAQKLVSKYLREHADIEAFAARVVSKTPDDRDSTPWVRVTELDAPAQSTKDHLVGFFMQFDCYATEDGGLPEASDLARTVRAVLMDIQNGEHDATFTGARIDGFARLPDTDGFEAARERYIITATIWAHSVSP